MSKAVVSSAAKRLGKLLVHEPFLLYEAGVYGQAFTLRSKLKRLQKYLEDADAKQETNARIYIWVADVKETAYDAEDAINTILEANAHTPTGVIRAFFGYFHKFILLRRVGMDIKKILLRIDNINSRLSTYNIIANVEGGHDQASSSSTEISRRRQLSRQSYPHDEVEDIIDLMFDYISLVSKEINFRHILSTVEGEHDQASSSSTEIGCRQQLSRQSYPHDEDEDVIGLEEYITSLVNELTTECNNPWKSRVVSIIGVGGLGKTTLAKKVYNHEIVKRHFDCCAWVFISHEQFDANFVLKEISRQVGAPAFAHDWVMSSKLKDYLLNKRYLVVLDDLQRAEDVTILFAAFPWLVNGGKILLTTHNRNFASPAFIIEPRCLNNEESWELFCKKAFPNNMIRISSINSISDSFEKLGREMVGKCGGLPLAIVVLGGLLSTKRFIKEWEVVSINLNYHLNKSGSEVFKILLSLSYDDLPYNLKPCFLYLGFLSKASFEISTKQLINLWIAEGFIQEENHQEEESVGEQLLHELIDRCIVQKGKLSVTGKVKTCRLHDMIRNICLLKAEEENFYHHGGNRPPLPPLPPPQYLYNSRASLFNGPQLRRYACDLFNNDQCYLFFNKYSIPHLRTLLVIIQPYGGEGTRYHRNIYNSFEKYKLLSVLVLYGDNIHLPEIGCLFHLRYLGLIGMDLIELPASIGNLRNLQTLDLSRSIATSIPNTIWKMEQLRHLYINDSTSRWSRVADGPLGIGNLRNLETLSCMHAGNWIKEIDLLNLTNLCELGIRYLSRSQVEVVLGSIADRPSSSWNSCLLRSLSLKLSDPYEGFPNLEPLTHCSGLSKLSLNGEITQAEFLNFPSYLTKLSLINSGLEYDPMKTLQYLPNLACLRLCSAYVGKHMVCYKKGFPKLEFLLLSTLHGLEEWTVRKGGMPCLRELSTCTCRKLKMLPEGLRFVTTLTKIEMIDMSTEFNERVKEGGEDWYKIKYVPSVKIVTNR